MVTSASCHLTGTIAGFLMCHVVESSTVGKQSGMPKMGCQTISYLIPDECCQANGGRQKKTADHFVGGQIHIPVRK